MVSGIEIIGNGNIGEKARQLLEKTPQLIEIGFHVPKRFVLAEDYFDGFFQRNHLGAGIRNVRGATEDLEQKIKNGTLTREEFKILQKVASSYGQSPLAIRSSAEGDARGTGTYKTAFSENKFATVRRTLQTVLASYFSPDAIAFRRDANTGEGFAIIVEPIIGQKIQNWCFAPILSGFGYTSTSRGEGYVSVVPGLGGGVDSKDVEKISRIDLEEFKGNLSEYTRKKEKEFHDSIVYQSGILKGSALTRTDGDLMHMLNRGEVYHGTAYFPPNSYSKGDVSRTSISFKGEIQKWFNQINLFPLYSMMKKMEQTFGKPQYFEWAMTLNKDGTAYWITQIADVNKKIDIMDFKDLGRVIFMGHTVTGTGIKECYKIANCWDPHEVPSLHEFNQHNTNYVLVFSSRMTTGGAQERLSYRNFSNASVFLEIQEAKHAWDPVSHLGGQLDVAGKFFGVLDYEGEVKPNWKHFKSREINEYGLNVYDGRVKVVASEKQNKMVVAALD